MIKLEKLEDKPSCKVTDCDGWADYIEMHCICSPDGLITKTDIIDIICDVDIEEQNELDRGSSIHSEQYDKFSTRFDDYFKTIAYRADKFVDYYPFELIDNNCLKFKGVSAFSNKKNQHYIFLLLCSNLPLVSKSESEKLSLQFEKYCQTIMKTLVSVDSETYIFGTSRTSNLFRGNLRQRMESLSQLLNSHTTNDFKISPKYDVPNGDGGIDLVSFLTLDSASHIPVALGQCTCNHSDWTSKQLSISQARISQIFAPLAPYQQYMFVPFFFRNIMGDFYDGTEILTCLIDRERIIHRLESTQECPDINIMLNIENFATEFPIAIST